MIKTFFHKLFEEFAEIRFAAASLAFSTLLSLIPFLIVILTVFQSVGGLEQHYPKAEGLLLSYLKDATGSTVTQYLKTTISQVKTTALGFTGALILILTTFGLIRNIDFAFQKIWKTKTRKTFYKRLGLYALVLMGTPALIAALIGLRSVNSIQIFSHTLQQKFLVSMWIWLTIWVLYTVIPDMKISKTSSLISSFLASAALAIVQSSFLWASVKLFKQNKIYGSLASLPIFLFWLLIVWYVILSGASLCAFLQQKFFKRS